MRAVNLFSLAILVVSSNAAAQEIPKAGRGVAYRVPRPQEDWTANFRQIELPPTWTCEAPNGDFDGDNFIGPGDDNPPKALGEFVADKPQLLYTLSPNTLEAEIVVQERTTGKHVVKHDEIKSSDRVRHQNAAYSSEIRSEYAEKYSAGITGELNVFDMLKSIAGMGAGTPPKLVFTGSANVESSFVTKDVWTYTDQKRADLRNFVQDILNQEYAQDIVISGNAGRITGDLDIQMYAPQYKTGPIKITDLVVVVYAYDPQTGHKSYVGEQPFGTFSISHNQSITLSINIGPTKAGNYDDGINTAAMKAWLYDGYTFGFEINVPPSMVTNSYDLLKHYGPIGASTASVVIKNDDNTTRPIERLDLSIFSPNKTCKTIREVLEDGIFDSQTGGTDVIFGYLPDGTPVVESVRGFDNVHAEHLFEELSDPDKDEYRRWMIAYKPGLMNASLNDFDIDHTIVFPGDRIYLYRLSRDDFEQPPTQVPPPVDAADDDVGVIANGSCPAGSRTVTIAMDNEDDNFGTTLKGWYGAIKNDSNNNTQHRLCRVEGSLFKPTVSLAMYPGGVNLNHYAYAVVKLGSNCPAGSVEFSYWEDNEDDGNENWHSGPLNPGSSQDSHGTTWNMCIFGATQLASEPILESFPNLGAAYGVFAMREFIGALGNSPKAYGNILIDDEDNVSGNQSHGTYPQGEIGDTARQIIYATAGDNTVMNFVRVRN